MASLAEAQAALESLLDSADGLAAIEQAGALLIRIFFSAAGFMPVETADRCATQCTLQRS